MPSVPSENRTAIESQPAPDKSAGGESRQVANPPIIDTIDRILEKWHPEISRIIALGAAFMEGRSAGVQQQQAPSDPMGIYSRPTYRVGHAGIELVQAQPVAQVPAALPTPQPTPTVKVVIDDMDIKPALKQMFSDAFAQLETFKDMKVGEALPLLRANEDRLIATAEEYIHNAAKHDRPSGETVSDSGTQGERENDSGETHSEPDRAG